MGGGPAAEALAGAGVSSFLPLWGAVFPRTGFPSSSSSFPGRLGDPGLTGSVPPLGSLCVRQRGCPAPGPLSHPFDFSQLTRVPCQLRETGDHDPFLLLGAHLKRELAGEPLYRRALREWGLPGWCPAGLAGSGDVGRCGLCAQGTGSRAPPGRGGPGARFPSRRVRTTRSAAAHGVLRPGAPERRAAEAGSPAGNWARGAANREIGAPRGAAVGGPGRGGAGAAGAAVETPSPTPARPQGAWTC